MNIRSLILFLAAGVLFFSCTKEEPFKQSGYTAGAATRVTLTLKNDKLQSMEQQGKTQTNRTRSFAHGVPTTGSMVGSKTFVPKDESLITNVHILVFNPAGEIVSNNYIGKLNFSETSNIVTETYCGENMDVWVLANGDVNDAAATGMNAELQKVKSLSDLQPFLVSAKGDGLSRPDRLTMVGNTTITIAPDMLAIPIQMSYLAAKVTVTVTDKTPADVEITIIGWDMVNIPKRTYLKERTSEDAVSGTIADDYLATSHSFPFETIHTDTKTWGQSFYLFENRRGKRVDRPLPTNPSERYPGMKVGDDNQRGKAWYAPPGATYMLIYGTYSKSGQMNNVVYKIYLGENPVDNYDIKRGKHYQYNVNVNGLNDIYIDTNVDWGTADFTVQLGENLQMDAHPDFRVFRIGGIATDNDTPAHATIEVLGADGNACDWLALSPMDIYRHGIKQSGNANQPFTQEAVGRYVRTMYSNTIVDESTLADATYQMARRITHIPFDQIAVCTYQDVILYADELEDPNGERRGKVKITYYKGADAAIVAGVQHFEVMQQGPIKISDNLYIERYEESAMYLHPTSNFGVQNTSTMQWGHNDGNMLYTVYDRFCNGNFLTANAVYKTVAARNGMNTPQWTTAAYDQYYRATYPRAGNPITEPSGTATTGYPYYYPDLTVSTPPNDYFHPIYNTSAARYCHEKNRDKNGDGIIDANETVWYLPSYSDMEAVENNRPALQPLNGGYWTSTEANANESWTFVFSITPATSSRSKSSKAVLMHARCVRGTGTPMQEPSLSGTATLGISAGTSDEAKLSIIDEVDFGLTWTISSNAPTWLKIATDISGTGAADTHTGIGPKTLYAYASTANNTGSLRTATITLKRDGSSEKTTTAKQMFLPPLTIDKTSMELLFLDEESQAFKITDKNTNTVDWKVTSNQAWLSISTNPLTKGTQSRTGNGNATLYAYIDSRNTSTSTQRTAIITISRLGMTDKTITVRQKPTPSPYHPAPHVGWAGSNIYWDATNKRLTFDDKGVTTNADYQGVTFHWSLLVPISPVYPISVPGSIIFSPTPIFPPYNVPQLIHTPNETDANWHHLLEAHNPGKNIGDICRYISKRGWAPGATSGKTWRMPTYHEMSEFLSYSWTSTYKVVLPVSPDGTSNILYGRLGDKEKLSLPANGWHAYLGTSGRNGHHAGYMGIYWTGTGAGAGTAILLHFNQEQSMKPVFWWQGVNTVPAAVRCVLEPQQ